MKASLKLNKKDKPDELDDISEDENKTTYAIVERPIGIIYNVKAVGRKRMVSVESQALIANNLPHPITLVFEIW